MQLQLIYFSPLLLKIVALLLSQLTHEHVDVQQKVIFNIYYVDEVIFIVIVEIFFFCTKKVNFYQFLVGNI